MQILTFVSRRLAFSALVLFGVASLVFVLTRTIPNEPAALYLGPRARPAEIAEVNARFGFDRPLSEQYVRYLRALVGGDLGMSLATKRPVALELGSRLAATLELLGAAMLIAVVVGVPLGVASTRLRGRASDALVRVTSVIGVSMPAFWLGLLLQMLFVHALGWFPVAGRVDAGLRFISPLDTVTGFYLIDALVTGNLVALRDAFMHLVLPAVTLAAYPIGLVTRMTRAAMLEVLSQDYIRTARAYGISEARIHGRLALRNAIGPTLTVIGLTLAFLLTGAFYVEVIYNWPGLGSFTVRSFLNLDYPAILGMTLFGAAGYVVVNLLVDLAQIAVDPRVRVG
ncbi:MAG TPA: ABC transporter permease [Trueperaceae bacterium]|nr:ABC transporter permease [Trueperaceae bacterium]